LAHHWLSRLYAGRDDLVRSIAHCKRAIAAHAILFELDPHRREWAAQFIDEQLHLGDLLTYQWSFEEARQQLEQACDLMRKLREGDNHNDWLRAAWANAQVARGRLFLREQRHAEACERFAEAAAVRDDLQHDDPRNAWLIKSSADAHQYLAWTLGRMNLVAASIEHYSIAKRGFEGIASDGPLARRLDLVGVKLSLGAAHLRMGAPHVEDAKCELDEASDMLNDLPAGAALGVDAARHRDYTHFIARNLALLSKRAAYTRE
jgi:tetratricopeptide (TPR) repeat protein